MDAFRASLHRSWCNHGVKELRVVCQFNHIPHTGVKKAVLIQRLMQAQIPEQSARDIAQMKRSLKSGGKRVVHRASYAERDNSDSESSDDNGNDAESVDADAETDVDMHTSPSLSPIDTNTRRTSSYHTPRTTMPLFTSPISRTTVATRRPDPESKYNSENDAKSDSADAAMSDIDTETVEREWYDCDPCSGGWRRMTHKRAKHTHVSPPATPTTTRTYAHARSTSTTPSRTSQHVAVPSSPSRVRPQWTNTTAPSSVTTSARVADRATTSRTSTVNVPTHSQRHLVRATGPDSVDITSCERCGHVSLRRFDICANCRLSKQDARRDEDMRQVMHSEDQRRSSATASQFSPADLAAIRAVFNENSGANIGTPVSSSSIDATSRYSSSSTSSSGTTVVTVGATPPPTTTASKADVDKAVGGLFVHLRHFLINKFTSADDADEERALFGGAGSGEARLVLRLGSKLNKREINSLQSFTEAWLALIKCVCTVCPARLLDYLDFLEVIVGMVRDHSVEAALSYAEAVRLARQGPNHVLAPIDSDLYIKAITGAIGTKFKSAFTRTGGNSSNSGAARRRTYAKDNTTGATSTCHRYNRSSAGCEKAACEYQHACEKCHGSHPVSRCSKKQNSGTASSSPSTGTHTTGKSSGVKRTADGAASSRQD